MVFSGKWMKNLLIWLNMFGNTEANLSCEKDIFFCPSILCQFFSYLFSAMEDRFPQTILAIFKH